MHLFVHRRTGVCAYLSSSLPANIWHTDANDERQNIVYGRGCKLITECRQLVSPLTIGTSSQQLVEREALSALRSTV